MCQSNGLTRLLHLLLLLECAGGTFGLNCHNRCHCNYGIECNPQDGSCPNECAQDWLGDNCQTGRWLESTRLVLVACSAGKGVAGCMGQHLTLSRSVITSIMVFILQKCYVSNSSVFFVLQRCHTSWSHPRPLRTWLIPPPSPCAGIAGTGT